MSRPRFWLLFVTLATSIAARGTAQEQPNYDRIAPSLYLGGYVLKPTYMRSEHAVAVYNFASTAKRRTLSTRTTGSSTNDGTDGGGYCCYDGLPVHLINHACVLTVTVMGGRHLFGTDTRHTPFRTVRFLHAG